MKLTSINKLCVAVLLTGCVQLANAMENNGLSARVDASNPADLEALLNPQGAITTAPVAIYEVQVLSRRGSYFDWGQGRNGWGYCYEWTDDGQVLNRGEPVPNFRCEERRPSHYDWGQGRNGWGYCYQYTPAGIAMNEGSPQIETHCELVSPSYYSWGRGTDGHTYCYQYTPKHVAMNEGLPVSNYRCR